jgi:hypothetical protein
MTRSNNARFLFTLGLTMVSAASGALGCSADDPDSGKTRSLGTAGTLGNAGSGVAGSGVASSGAAGSGVVAGSGASGVNGAGAGASGTGVDNECGGQTYMAEPKAKLDIYMVFDDSGSMLLLPPFAWEPAKAATKAFLSDAASAGIGVGLKFFGSECDPNVYATPDVPIADLPAQSSVIASTLDARFPVADTMTEPALKGALAHQRQWLQTHPDSKAIILLITDGEPDSDCGGALIGDGSAVAADAFNGSPSIPVYVLGLGNVANINSIAQAGGTGQAFVVDPNANSGQAVVDAFNQIRSDAQPLPCEFTIPEGGAATPDLVNLAHTAGGATSAQTIASVGDAAGCASNGDLGWYYDDPAAPKTILTCAGTCTQLSSGGAVEVALGCPTVVVE